MGRGIRGVELKKGLGSGISLLKNCRDRGKKRGQKRHGDRNNNKGRPEKNEKNKRYSQIHVCCARLGKTGTIQRGGSQRGKKKFTQAKG